MKHGWLVALLALTGCTSGATHAALLGDATGISEGTPVTAAGVQVGEVEAVSVRGADALVTFRVSSDHEVALKSDACVSRRAGEGGASLVLFAGRSGEPFAAEALPSCTTAAADALLDIGRRLTDTVQEAVEGIDAHEVGRRVGEGVQELGDGFGEGVGDFHEAGRQVGRAAREFERGVEEGSAD